MSASVLGSNPAFSLQSIQAAQAQALLGTAQLSSGKRITNAAVDPSGLAIYNTLTAQAQGADTANVNITEAASAVSVAQGAAAGIQTALGQINNLAIEANNGFNAPSDNAALQAEATQLAQGINQTAAEVNFNGTTLLDGGQSGSVAPAAAATTGATNPGVSVQSGADAGQTTTVSFPDATTSGLGITNIDLSTPTDATNTEGQISGAETSLALGEATLGGESASLGAAFDNNAVLSNNLTASASAIGDVNVAQAVTSAHQTVLQQQISLALLANANTNAGHLNAFLSTYA